MDRFAEKTIVLHAGFLNGDPIGCGRL
jgi:hypothetical protein